MLRDSCSLIAAAVAASAKEGEVGASDHEKARNFLQLARVARAQGRAGAVGRAAGRGACAALVLAEDEDSEGVKASDVKRRWSRNSRTRLRSSAVGSADLLQTLRATV